MTVRGGVCKAVREGGGRGVEIRKFFILGVVSTTSTPLFWVERRGTEPHFGVRERVAKSRCDNPGGACRGVQML